MPPNEWVLDNSPCEPTKKGVAFKYAAAIERIPEDRAVVVMEQDDWYGPEYLEYVRGAVEKEYAWAPPTSSLIAPQMQRHWHVSRNWHSVQDCAKHGGRCADSAETALTFTTILSAGRVQALKVLRTGKVDCAAMWGDEKADLMPLQVVAVKGIRGTGTSTKHQLHRSKKRGHVWHEDLEGKQLRWWMGEDAETYLQGDLV